MSTKAEASTALAADDLVELYRLMTKVHLADARVRKGLSAGEFAMSYWPVDGHEAISAGAAFALAQTDRLVTTYRGLGDVVAKGINLPHYFAELLGRASGLSKGKAGAMGISDANSGVAWATG